MLLPWVGWKGLERGNPRADPIKEDCLVVLTCSNMLQPIPNVNIQVNIESTTGIFVPSSSYGHPLATYLADNFNPQEIELLETINHPKGRTQFLKPQTINRQNNRCKIMSIFGDVPTAPIEYIETAAKTCLLNQSSASFLLKKCAAFFRHVVFMCVPWFPQGICSSHFAFKTRGLCADPIHEASQQAFRRAAPAADLPRPCAADPRGLWRLRGTRGTDETQPDAESAGWSFLSDTLW